MSIYDELNALCAKYDCPLGVGQFDWLGSQLAKLRAVERGIVQLSGNRRLSLGFHDKVYGDDDDLPTHGNWVVWQETGSINDREWLVRGFGPTPLEAIAAAFAEEKSGE